MTGVLVLAAAVLLAVALALWRARADGGFRRATRPEVHLPALDAVRAVGAHPGERATLLQFSSAFCAPCRTTRVLLGAVAAAEPGVVHVEVDAEQHLDLVRALGILRTPTTLILDGAGRERTRASGAPRREQVLAALTALSR